MPHVSGTSPHAPAPLQTEVCVSTPEKQVFAPHVVEKDGRFHLFYTGVDGQRRQRICLATSEDLSEWTRSDASP